METNTVLPTAFANSLAIAGDPFEVADPIKQLEGKYQLKNRYSNFGHVLRSVCIKGFRGIIDLRLEFDFPVTAFSGLNGAGKSTVGQIAICGYRKPQTSVGYKRYYVKDFFPVCVADPSPFSEDATIQFSYETTDFSEPQTVTISRAQSQWSGYKRQPERYCYYVGFTLYIPKVEHRDLSIYRGTAIELRDSRQIAEEVRSRVAKILNVAYEDLLFQGIGHKNREAELGLAQRYGARYSENNMGFGEGRVLYMVDMMEEAPEQSLFVLEEPETSLHEEAQYRLAKYIVDVCNRRHHQVILSTHSSIILEALPPIARKLLLRDADGVTQFSGISSTRARAILSGGHQRSLTVCVEDEFAKLVVTELIRRFDPDLLRAVLIAPVGSKDAVREAVRLLGKLQKKAVGVRDGDVGQGGQPHLLCLPGTRPPEIEVYEHEAVAQILKQEYGFDIADFIAINPEINHHEFTERIAEDLSVLPDALRTTVVKQYVNNLDEASCLPIFESLKQQA